MPIVIPAQALWAINNPKLLMLSGIGASDHLSEVGITPTHHLPGVGQNLQDHLEIYIQMECLKPVSIYKYYNLAGKALVGAQWLFTRGGMGASNQFRSGRVYPQSRRCGTS